MEESKTKRSKDPMRLVPVEERRRFSFTLFGWLFSVQNYKTTKNNKAKARLSLRHRRMELAGHRCEICGTPTPLFSYLHHRLPAGHPDRKKLENVVVVCTECNKRLHKEPHLLALCQLEDTTVYDGDKPMD